MRSLPFVAAILLGACNGSPAAPADTIIFGKIWTGEVGSPIAEAVAVRGDSILAVGDSAAVAAVGGASTRRIVAPGLVVPGFIDDHVHLFGGGAQLASVDLRDAATPEEFIRRIRAFAATIAPGEWIQNGNWDHQNWPGAPLPDRTWIDSVTPNNPIFLNRIDGHMYLANTAAMTAAGIDRTVQAVQGGEVGRRPSGDLTGVFKDEAYALIGRAIPDPTQAQQDSSLARAMRYLASFGVTAVASVSTSWDEICTLERARARGVLTIRVSNYTDLADWYAAAESLRTRGPGDDWIRTAGVKGLIDGALGSTTAYFDAPYTDLSTTAGFLTIPEDSARRWITAADSAGLQLAVHAIGDRANGLVLDLFAEAASANGPRDRRFRIEHAQHLRPRDIPRFAALGVIPSVQPYHAADDGRWAEKHIGSERIKTTYPFRSLLDAGARLVFGSDWFVAPPVPLLGIEAAVTRRTIDGRKIFVPEERITVEEALRAYTVDNAYAMYFDAFTGRIARGMKADLVVLDRDILTMPADSISRAAVTLTMVGGKTVYRRP